VRFTFYNELVTAGSATGVVVRFEPGELEGPEGAGSQTKSRQKNREMSFYNALVTAPSEDGVPLAASESLPSVPLPTSELPPFVPPAGVAVVCSSVAEPPPHSHPHSQRHIIVVVEDSGGRRQSRI
jgi:hypothetical protein